MDKQELARRIYGASHLTGKFLLRSGQYSNEYFDKYLFESDPELLAEIAAGMAELLPAGTELLGGLELGGVPLATAISLKTGLPALFVRKAAKTYGTCRQAEGPDFKGKNICLIEDVITTGGAVLEGAKALTEGGGSILGVVCAIYRGKGDPAKLGDIPLHPLFTMADLAAAGKKI